MLRTAHRSRDAANRSRKRRPGRCWRAWRTGCSFTPRPEPIGPSRSGSPTALSPTAPASAASPATSRRRSAPSFHRRLGAADRKGCRRLGASGQHQPCASARRRRADRHQRQPAGRSAVRRYRIGGFAQSSTQLGFAYSPPPYNGGTNSGDVFFNTAQSWQINGTTYDLETVAVHELGHALGLDHSSLGSADMYPNYSGAKQSPTTDDTSGIQAIYKARQSDYLDSQASNDTASTDRHHAVPR